MSLRRQEIADRLSAWTIFNDKNKEFCEWLTQMENKACHRGDLSMEEMVEKLKKVRQQTFRLSFSLFLLSLVSSPKHAHVVKKDNTWLQHLTIIVSGCWLGWKNYSRLTRSTYFRSSPQDCMEEINLFSENKSHLKQLGEQLLLASEAAKQTQVRGSLLEVNQRWHSLFHNIEAR